jgi:hypothetical protein
MQNLLDQLKLGIVPYITVKDLEERIRDRVLAKIDTNFYRTCFETIINETKGALILAGGAATACHINDPHESLSLKCLDVDYYGNDIKLNNLQRNLQDAVYRVKNDLDFYIAEVNVQDPLILFKTFKNGAYKMSDCIQLAVDPMVCCIKTEYNKDFDLIRFAIRANVTANNMQEYDNQNIFFTKNASLPLYLFFVNMRIMKSEFNEERCVKTLRWFGESYKVMLLSVQKVLNNEILCLMKDIFTFKFNYKIERRSEHIIKLLSKLPTDCYQNCVNDKSFQVDNKSLQEISTFVKKILDINGPVLGCKKLVQIYLRTNNFTDAVPLCVMQQVNYLHKNWVSENWSKFISYVNKFVNTK